MERDGLPERISAGVLPPAGGDGQPVCFEGNGKRGDRRRGGSSVRGRTLGRSRRNSGLLCAQSCDGSRGEGRGSGDAPRGGRAGDEAGQAGAAAGLRRGQCIPEPVL